jgi:hypothetical protein
LEETTAYCRKLISVDQDGHVWLALEALTAQVSKSVNGFW